MKRDAELDVPTTEMFPHSPWLGEGEKWIWLKILFTTMAR